MLLSAGGFREWWRRLTGGSDEQLDNAHVMRMAGRFIRRIRGFARAQVIPAIDCRRAEPKDEIMQPTGGTATTTPLRRVPGGSFPGGDKELHPARASVAITRPAHARVAMVGRRRVKRFSFTS